MGWRGPVVLAALLALGVAGGYVASRAQEPGGAAGGVASPVGARLPVDPPLPPAKDPGDAALQPGLELTTDTLGVGKYALAVPVPVGWTMNLTASNEAKWKQPRTSNNTYVMRVEQVREDGRTIPEALALRVRALDDEQDDVRIVGRTEDSVEYTYTSNEGTRRHSFIRWRDVSGSGLAEVEVVVHGRERDVPGTSDLVDRVTEGIRPA